MLLIILLIFIGGILAVAIAMYLIATADERAYKRAYKKLFKRYDPEGELEKFKFYAFLFLLGIGILGAILGWWSWEDLAYSLAEAN